MEENLPSKMESKKKAGFAILISDKRDFKATKIKRDKGGHYIMVKGSIQQEELTILNIYKPIQLLPNLGYCEQCCNKYVSACIFSIY